MYLKELIEFLSKMPSEAVARPAFGGPMSHRANYCDLAFDPIEQSTAGEMLKHATAALRATFTGYKGGDYTMTEWTDCYLASYGLCGDALTEATLDAMFKVPALEAKLSASEREAERLREALTPSGETKAAYIGEFEFTYEVFTGMAGNDPQFVTAKIPVPWTTIKDIMHAITKRAALRGEEAPRE